ncbi:MAG: hypothetical protein M3Q08_01680 [Pseudomonadota bacterium]|nr:hypothetical protein [Pseudomonadota bacterium]
MDKARDLLSIWTRGFFLLVLLVISLAAGAVAAAVPIVVLGALLGWDQDREILWLLLLSPLWAPLWAGFVARDAYRFFPPDRGASMREWRAARVK